MFIILITGFVRGLLSERLPSTNNGKLLIKPDKLKKGEVEIGYPRMFLLKRFY